MTLAHWIHHLFNPHCDICREAASDEKVCQSCETLKVQLSIANDEKRQMLNSILAFNKPIHEEPAQIDYEKVKPKMMTWNVRKQMLEAEDREAARLMAERKIAQNKIREDIKELEKEVGLEVKDA